MKEQIENYWKQINRVQYENPQISCKNSDIFSSVDIGAWEKEFNEAFPELYRQNFPQNFTKRMNGLLHDLKILLPNNRAVKAILPVLLVSYFQNKRCGDLFADILNDEDLGESFDYDKKINLFLPRSIENRYPKLECQHCKVANAQRIFPVFLNALQFLFFLIRTKGICNISMSFYIFEYLTGYLKLLNRQSEELIDKLDQFYKKHTITKRCKLDNDIINFSEGVIKDAQKDTQEDTQEDTQYILGCEVREELLYPLQVYTFMGRLRRRLDPNWYPDSEISVPSKSNKKDLTKIALFLDAISSDALTKNMDEDLLEIMEEDSSTKNQATNDS